MPCRHRVEPLYFPGKNTLFSRVEFKCWGSRAEGDRHARTWVSMNGWDLVEARSAGP